METVKTVYIQYTVLVMLGNEEKLVYLKCSILGCEVIYKKLTPCIYCGVQLGDFLVFIMFLLDTVCM